MHHFKLLVLNANFKFPIRIVNNETENISSYISDHINNNIELCFYIFDVDFLINYNNILISINILNDTNTSTYAKLFLRTEEFNRLKLEQIISENVNEENCK